MEDQREMRQSREPPLTVEQFLKRVDEDDYAEWVDGTVVLKGTESAAHQGLLGFLMCLLKWHTEDYDIGKVLTNPFLMKLPQSARAPDLLFVDKNNLIRLQRSYLDGPVLGD